MDIYQENAKALRSYILQSDDERASALWAQAEALYYVAGELRMLREAIAGKESDLIGDSDDSEASFVCPTCHRHDESYILCSECARRICLHCISENNVGEYMCESCLKLR